MRSKLDTETHLFWIWFSKSVLRPYDNLIVRMLVYDPLLLFLTVHSLHFRDYQVGGYDQWSGLGDASWTGRNGFRPQNVMWFLTDSAFQLHQWYDAVQVLKDYSKQGHCPIPPIWPKYAGYLYCLGTSLWMYWHGINLKLHCDKETPSDISLLTWSWPQFGTSTVP